MPIIKYYLRETILKINHLIINYQILINKFKTLKNKNIEKIIKAD